jgi:hypothetical protein
MSIGERSAILPSPNRIRKMADNRSYHINLQGSVMGGSVGFPSAQKGASIQLWTLPGVTFGKKAASTPPRGRCQSFHEQLVLTIAENQAWRNDGCNDGA